MTQETQEFVLEKAILDRIGAFGTEPATFEGLVRHTTNLLSLDCADAAVAHIIAQLMYRGRVVRRLRLVGDEITYERIF